MYNISFAIDILLGLMAMNSIQTEAERSKNIFILNDCSAI